MKAFLLIVLLVGLECSPNRALSQTPRTISYQGILLDQSGNPIADGNHVLALKLYITESAGIAVYSETQSVGTSHGSFNLTIGKVVPIPASLRFDVPYYLGLSVDGAAELSPRTALSSSPYSLHSITADTASALAVTVTGVVTNINGASGALVIRGDGSTNISTHADTLTIGFSGTGASIPKGSYLAFSDGGVHPGFTYVGGTQTIANNWNSKMPDTIARRGAAIGVVGNKMYVIGSPNLNSVYDPSTNTWTTKAPLPTPRSLVMGAVSNGIIYVIGGYDGTAQKTVEAYDPSKDTWTTKAPMPTARYSAAVTTINGKIYVVGGVGTAANEEYDPVTNTWSTRTPIPNGFEGSTASTLNGKMYVFGGNSGAINSAQNAEYTPPPTDSWQIRANLPGPVTAATATSLDGSIYILGGCLAGANTPFNSVLRYDPPPSDKYTSLINIPTPRLGAMATTINGKIYVVGGLSSSANEEYDPGTTLYWFMKN